jgi:hypothetical protein
MQMRGRGILRPIRSLQMVQTTENKNSRYRHHRGDNTLKLNEHFSMSHLLACIILKPCLDVGKTAKISVEAATSRPFLCSIL